MAAPPTNGFGNADQDNAPMLLVPAGNAAPANTVKNGFHTKTWGDGSKYIPRTPNMPLALLVGRWGGTGLTAAPALRLEGHFCGRGQW